MRIAILTHATDPHGDVAYALALGEALHDLGHEAVVHAPDPTGRGFFRDARCPVVSVAAGPACGGPVGRGRRRVADYLAHFSTPAACDFDVFHAHCGIGGNALATLTRRRLIRGFVRTVHDLACLADPELDQLQERAIVDAGRLLCLGRSGAAMLAAAYGARAEVVGSGIDRAVYAPEPGPGDADLARRLGLGPGPVFLGAGGSGAGGDGQAVIAAFAALRRDRPAARLVLAGDGPGCKARRRAAPERAGPEDGPGRPVLRIGPVAPADRPALYRLADALVFPAARGDAGPCALEAMACGIPVIVPARPPFTEDIAPGAALTVAPGDVPALAAAMRASLEPDRRAALLSAGREVVRAQAWEACARRHLPPYAALARGPAVAPAAATGSAAWSTTWASGDA